MLLRERLKGAGIYGDPAYVEAVKRLDGVSNWTVAVAPMVDAAMADPDLLLSLIGGRKEVERLAAMKLRQVWEDMNSIPREGVAGGVGHHIIGTHSRGAHPPADEMPGEARKWAKPINGVPRDPAPGREASGQSSYVGRTMTVAPSSPRRSYIDAARSASKVLANSLLDSLRVRDGRAIGDVRWAELEGLAKANRFEATILERVRQRGLPTDPAMRVRDLLTEEDMLEITEAARNV